MESYSLVLEILSQLQIDADPLMLTLEDMELLKVHHKGNPDSLKLIEICKKILFDENLIQKIT